MKVACLLVALCVVIISSASLADTPSDNVAPKTESRVMNGYSLEQFKDFLQWRLVTVRFRRDTNEMRIVYANDKAWTALQAGGKNYPDGAVFAKIGISTEDDPAFTSSAVPSGASRYQLMVMDHAKNSKTDGWGYALFSANGKTFEQNPDEQTAACAACHRLVPERGYVFSQPMKLDIDASAFRGANSVGSNLRFVTKDAHHLADRIREYVPAEFPQVRVVDNAGLSNNMIQGTIDEIRPTLAKEALRSGVPALLMNAAGTRFSMVIAHHQNGACRSPAGKAGVEMLAIYTIKPDASETYRVNGNTYCETEVR